MQSPLFPLSEQARLAALRALNLLDTKAEERFDRITRIAQQHFNVPIALVSLIDDCRQWFKSAQGLDALETPRDISFCGHAILGREIFHVPDTLEDPLFFDNPLVIGPPNIRFYAGAPLATNDGFHVGTFCIIGTQPRDLSPEERRTLRDLADWVQEEFSRIKTRESVHTLLENEALLQAIMNTVADGIITISEQGIIESLNNAAVNIFGYLPDEVIGQNIKCLMPEPYHSQHDGYINHFLTTRRPRVIGIGREASGKRKDGSTFPMELSINEALVPGRRFFTGIVRDISARKHFELKLQATTELQQAILDGTTYSIISTDTKGTIRTFNRAAELMLGYSASEVIGKVKPGIFLDQDEIVAHAKLLSKEFGEEVSPDLNTLIAKARRNIRDEREWTYISKDGKRTPVLLSLTALRDMEHHTAGFLGIAFDISDRKKIERMKNEFISTVSHELRTPLTSIRGSLGLIAGGIAGEIPKQAGALLEIAHKNSERLVRLINDILDIEKIEAGKMEFNLSTQPLLPLVRQSIDANIGFANQFQVSIELDSASENIQVSTDSDRLIQIITNLISNAAKFSPPQGVVSISLKRISTSENKPGRARLTISDNGPGIPEEFQPKIFGKFLQADSSDTRLKGGTGLGLAITKSLIESMDGQINFSTSSAGTSFWVEMNEVLPAKLTADSSVFSTDYSLSNHKVSTPERDLCGKRSKILVCEDDHDIAELIKLIIEGGGYQVDIAYSAESAKKMLMNHPYIAMTLDIGLPDMDGISLIRELRASPEKSGNAFIRDLPIIVVSASRCEGEANKVGAMSVADWLNKPIDHERLFSAVQNCVIQSSAIHPHQRPRVLHVDDDADIHHIVMAVANEVADFDYAADLKTANHLLSHNHYDLVILDLSLPDGLGSELLPKIAKMRPEPKVMVFSASDVPREQSELFAACLLKSVTSNDILLATIQAHTKLSSNHSKANLS